ncbi:hypothetical protein [Pontibacter actiniarum]|uniref:Uncharacterized protein n=1 Tax=Pontibacter actiniarum TaxID=323450 RepID=A0A1X9YQU5_9BACT|nr:hypothetical protein [Pontibacter actiniarum]ARS35243.1 hypothetical protein CA264_07195 [Pontibacter actiniarum]
MKKTYHTDACTASQPAALLGLHASDKLDIAYNAEEETLLVHWEGEASTAEIKAGYDWIISVVRELKPKKWLLDFHKRNAIRRRDQRWVFKEVFPEVLRQVKDDVFVAVVLPVTLLHGLVADLDGDELMDGNNFLIIQHFLYQEEGQRWLNEMYRFKQAAQNRAG